MWNSLKELRVWRPESGQNRESIFSFLTMSPLTISPTSGQIKLVFHKIISCSIFNIRLTFDDNSFSTQIITYITLVLISVRIVHNMQPRHADIRSRPHPGVAPASLPLPPHAARPSCTPLSDLDSGSHWGLEGKGMNVNVTSSECGH